MSADIGPPGTALERTLHRDFYLSEEIFAREKERIFYREWLCAGREEELPNPGDYQVVDVAGESVLVVRTRDGGLAAHYNVCRHRGSQLVPDAPRGTFSGGIRCPYHSWTYSLEGGLRTAPFLEESDGLTRSELSLHPVGVAACGGFFFLNLTPGEAAERGHTLAAQLGAVPDRLRRYPLGELRVARRIEYEVRANWKVMLENYNECYHCGPVHPELCRLVPAFKQRGGADLDWERGIPHRDGAWTFTRTGTSSRAPFAGLDEDERTRHKGELVYPNFLLSLSAEHVAAFTLWPREPARTTVVCEFLSSRRDRQAGLRPIRRGRVLGPGQPAGLDDLRIGAAGDVLTRVSDRLLRADGELEPGYKAIHPGAFGLGAGHRSQVTGHKSLGVTPVTCDL